MFAAPTQQWAGGSSDPSGCKSLLTMIHEPAWEVAEESADGDTSGSGLLFLIISNYVGNKTEPHFANQNFQG